MSALGCLLACDKGRPGLFVVEDALICCVYQMRIVDMRTNLSPVTCVF